METIWGKTSLDLDLAGLMDRLTNYSRLILDLGTGDGRYVRFLADKYRRGRLPREFAGIFAHQTA
jgi:hypothetical protein